MGDVSPIDADSLSGDELARASLKASLDVHRCVDSFRREQADREIEAARMRAALASSVKRISGRMNRLEKRQRGEEEARRSTDDKVTLLAKMFGAADWEPGERKRKPKSARSWLRDLGLAVFGACSLVGSGIVLGLGVLENMPGLAELLRHALRLVVTK